MFLALLVLLALGEGLRRTRHRLRAIAPTLRPGLRRMRGDLARWLASIAWWEWLAIAGAVALAAAVRGPDLDQPMRYDEAATWLDYASRPLHEALADYRFPNNHLFHTSLVHLSATLFGADPWALRLPAFAAGLLLVPLTWLLGRATGGPAAGIVAAWLVAASATLALYSTNARGYTIVCCLAVACALLASYQLRTDNPAGWALMALLAALGAWTIPTMLYPVIGIAAWMLASAGRGTSVIDRPTTRRRIGWTALGSVGIAALAYLPVVAQSGIALILGNRFVRPQSRRSFFAQLPGFFAELADDWTRGWPILIAVAAGVFVVVGVLARLRDRERANGGSLFGLALLAATLLLLVNGRVPYLRVWMYLIPLAAVAAGEGTAWLARRFARGRVARLAAIAIGVIGATVGAAGVVRSETVRRASDTGTMPDAARVAMLLADSLAPRDRIIASAPVDLPLSYYLQREGVRGRPLRALPDSSATIWIVAGGDPPQFVDALIRGAQVVRRDFSPPRLIARQGQARVFAMRRERPGCVLAPALCR